jgi:hypothetical protein
MIHGRQSKRMALSKLTIGLRIFTLTTMLSALFSSTVAHGQGKIVDPSKVAPEYREAAEKRAAEQKKIADCRRSADAAKVLPRYRTEFMIACVEK